MVLYAKSDVYLAPGLECRSVAEDALPGALVRDFASMTSGLLPGIALTSLAAVREGAHKVLDQFSADLDPAFLAHRACLTDPHDAERQIVNHVAEEFRGLMDNAVAQESPAGAAAVAHWLRCDGDGGTKFVFDKKLDLEDTIALANEGLKASKVSESAFEGLTAGFAGNAGEGLDERLAWIMSFRTVYGAPPPRLWLGTVVTDSSGERETHLICIRPRCDCVRLKAETSFYFLPLVPPKGKSEQIVIRANGRFRRQGIDLDQTGWVCRRFKPSTDSDAIIAERRESGAALEFQDVCGNRYTWRGELKAEYAQRIAQALAAQLSRVAIDESEWLRRMAGKRR